MDKQRVRDVIRALGSTRVGEACGVSKQVVNHWLRNGEVPARHVGLFCSFTGMKPEQVNRYFQEVA